VDVFIYCAGVEFSPLFLSSLIGLLHQRWMIDLDGAAISGMNDGQGKLKYVEKTCPCVNLATGFQQVSNPGHRGGKTATNHLLYGTAIERLV
jgi:hypothetical protein